MEHVAISGTLVGACLELVGDSDSRHAYVFAPVMAGHLGCGGVGTASQRASVRVQLEETERMARLLLEAAAASASALQESEAAVKLTEAEILAAKAADDSDGLKQREGRLFDLRRQLSSARRNATKVGAEKEEAASKLKKLKADTSQARQRWAHVWLFWDR